MVTVSIKDEYVEVLSALGDLQAAMDLAIQRQLSHRSPTKIPGLHSTARYGRQQSVRRMPMIVARIALVCR